MTTLAKDVISRLSNVSSPTDLAAQLTSLYNLGKAPPYTGENLCKLGKDLVLATTTRDLAFLDRSVWHIVTILLGLVDDLASVVYLEVFFFMLLITSPSNLNRRQDLELLCGSVLENLIDLKGLRALDDAMTLLRTWTIRLSGYPLTYGYLQDTEFMRFIARSLKAIFRGLMIDPGSEQGEHMWKQLGADLMSTLREFQIVLNLNKDRETQKKEPSTEEEWEREKALTVTMISQAPARFQTELLSQPTSKAKL